MLTNAIVPVKLPLNRFLTLYLLGEESVLFSKQSIQLYGLDRAASVAFLRLEQGEDRDVVSRDLGMTQNSALLLDDLAALLAGKESPVDEYQRARVCPREVPDQRKGLPCYRLLQTVFSVDGPDELLKRVTPNLAQLQTVEGGKADLLITLQREGRSCRLLMNNAPQGGFMPPERIVPLLYDRLRKYAYQNISYLLTIHGTVVARDGQTLILPGLSGSGKSTLAAALLSRGYSLLSDEPAVIDPASGGVLPMPLGLALKAGSWPVVQGDYPGMDRLPVHLRFDGQLMRYLLPDSIRYATGEAGRPVTHMIFPRYSPNSTANVERLGPVQALRAVTTAGYQVPELGEDRVVGILNWICGVACYSLVYSSSEEAMRLLEALQA